MIAAIITLGFVSLTAILVLSAMLNEANKRHAAELQSTIDVAAKNMNLMFEQLAESRRNEAKAMQDVVDIQAKIIKEQQKTISEQHTRLTMQEAQASADLNEQYADFQTRNQMALANGIPEPLVTTGSPNGHTPSGWSDPAPPIYDIPDEIPVVPREEEPNEL